MDHQVRVADLHGEAVTPLNSDTPVPPHCRDPENCSVCRGATPRVVTQEGAILKVDGVAVDRPIDPRQGAQPSYGRVYPRRAGAKRRR